MASPSTREIKVKDISDEIDNWVIKVRVHRSWPTFDTTDIDDMIGLELVLIDSEGTRIQGSTAIEVVCAKCFNLNEGDYYEIGRVEVVENDELDRVTDHPFKLVFWNGSIVEPWKPGPFSAYDTVALCTSISSERFHVIDNRVVKMILLELTDHTGQIECVLYDEYVGQLHDYLKSNGVQTQVVVFHMVRMMPFEPALFGTSVVQVIPTVTKLVFNPAIVEVFNLYDWYNVKADVFDGVELRAFYLDDHHVINYLTKSPAQTKNAMLNELKKICPIEDSFLKSNEAVEPSAQCLHGATTAADVASSSS
ncbi:Nucleic acid-binding, OB-fold [Sesbania bispinosa]|nr:Nucleic acid-binding, OB-fold [Sesbania bispinosa]